MTDETNEDSAEVITALVERFQEATASRNRNAKHTIDDEEYVDMFFRMIRALERRAIENPAILSSIRAAGARLDEVVNVAIAANAERYHKDPRLGASMMECARLLDISKQGASMRKKRGVAAMLARVAAAGVVVFAERRRERELYLDEARETANVVLVDFRARRSA